MSISSLKQPNNICYSQEYHPSAINITGTATLFNRYSEFIKINNYINFVISYEITNLNTSSNSYIFDIDLPYSVSNASSTICSGVALFSDINSLVATTVGSYVDINPSTLKLRISIYFITGYVPSANQRVDISGSYKIN